MAGVYSAGEFRNGTTFEMEGNVFRVVEFQHVKPGKGSAFVRTKLKNVITGAVLEKTFNPSDKYPGAEIEKKTMQYLYNDGDLYYFMDNETYDQMPLNKDTLGDCLKYLKENMEVTILSYKGNVFAVDKMGGKTSAFEIIPNLYYPFLLLISLLVFIYIVPEKKSNRKIN